MKILVVVILIMAVSFGSAAAMPAAPIWAMRFDSGSYYTNSLFQTNEMNFLTASTTTGNGTRFSVGFGPGRNGAPGAEEKVFVARIDKQLKDDWTVSVGYQGGNSLFGGINIGSVYNVTPNASLSVGYSITNYNELKNFITSQLYIRF